MAAIDPLLEEIPMGSHGAEIGVARGESALRLITERRCRMLLVDPWCNYEGYPEQLGSGTAFDECMARLKPVREHWIALMMKSADAAALIPAVGNFDFVFIDGNHTYDYVLNDCHAWWPHVRSGGLLCGHDWNLSDWNRGVQRAVEAFAWMINGKIQVHSHANELQCWSIRKS